MALSELGEPIHKVATHGVKLWKEFDDTVFKFKLPKEKPSAWMIERRDEVIRKSNKFQSLVQEGTSNIPLAFFKF